MKKYVIAADSSSDVLGLEGIAFCSAPLKIITPQKEYTDNEELDVEQMVDELLELNSRSGTACPGVGDWLEAFGDGERVFCVTITSTLSGCYNSAVIAAREYEETHPGAKVFVIDSLSTGPEMKLIIEKLKELIDEGLEYEDICQRITEYKERTGLMFVLESLKNLANNGRVSKIAAGAAGLLGIRVVGKASDRGDLEQLAKCRGSKKAMEAVVQYLEKFGYKGGKLCISHCCNFEAAQNLKKLISDKFALAQIEIYKARGLCSFYAEKGGLLVGFEK